MGVWITLCYEWYEAAQPCGAPCFGNRQSVVNGGVVMLYVIGAWSTPLRKCIYKLPANLVAVFEINPFL